ncbi:MAG: hypothetical protein IPL47_06720 [Phyllobacteriaceae bacterium]|nr:hypothetical protein [Phyllobacteriaceae bacterium]
MEFMQMGKRHVIAANQGDDLSMRLFDLRSARKNVAEIQERMLSAGRSIAYNDPQHGRRLVLEAPNEKRKIHQSSSAIQAPSRRPGEIAKSH